jgi:hypothetical protein
MPGAHISLTIFNKLKKNPNIVENGQKCSRNGEKTPTIPDFVRKQAKKSKDIIYSIWFQLEKDRLHA